MLQSLAVTSGTSQIALKLVVRRSNTSEPKRVICQDIFAQPFKCKDTVTLQNSTSCTKFEAFVFESEHSRLAEASASVESSDKLNAISNLYSEKSQVLYKVRLNFLPARSIDAELCMCIYIFSLSQTLFLLNNQVERGSRRQVTVTTRLFLFH